MEILTPLNDMTYLEKLVEAGASELYFGFYDQEWTAKFGTNSCINRMSNFAEKANRIEIGTVTEVIDKIHDIGAKCYLTLNAAQYSTVEIQQIESYLDRLETNMPDGIIVSGIETARAVLRRNMVPVASTMCGIYNAEIAKYYARAGVRRMIFPREITLAEMKSIKKQCPKVQFEAFFMRNGCMFSDASCLGIHSLKFGSLCAGLCQSKTLIQGDRRDFASIHAAEENSIIYHQYYHKATCGMCALYKLKELGIHSLKIVGRADRPEAILRDVSLICENMHIAETASNEEEYLQKMIFPKDRFYRCKNGLSCYYPEVRF